MLLEAYAAHPERFPNGVPTPAALPEAVWINKPKECGCRPESDTGGDETRESEEIRPNGRELLLVGAH